MRKPFKSIASVLLTAAVVVTLVLSASAAWIGPPI
jgi:hypothetical protein